MRTVRCLLVAALASLVSCVLAADAPRNVIVIGWDGAQRNHVREMLGRGELPTLTALAAEGKLVDIDVTTGATDTKAGWTQILTGMKPEQTGVFSNAKYQPIPAGFSIFERLEAQFGDDGIYTAAIVGKKGNVDADAPRKVPYAQWQRQQQRQQRKAGRVGPGNAPGVQIVEENGQKFVLVPGKPWYNASQAMDLWVNGLLLNDKVGDRAMAELTAHKDQRFFLFVHFANPDHDGHKFGENSQEYTDALKSDDEWTGKILAKLRELGLYDSTLVYVTADHGFNEDAKGHPYAPYVFLGTNDREVSRDGDRADIAPTILKRFGVDLAAAAGPTCDGTPLDVAAERRIAPATKPGVVAKPKPKAKAGAAQGAKRQKPKQKQPPQQPEPGTDAILPVPPA